MKCQIHHLQNTLNVLFFIELADLPVVLSSKADESRSTARLRRLSKSTVSSKSTSAAKFVALALLARILVNVDLNYTHIKNQNKNTILVMKEWIVLKKMIHFGSRSIYLIIEFSDCFADWAFWHTSTATIKEWVFCNDAFGAFSGTVQGFIIKWSRCFTSWTEQWSWFWWIKTVWSQWSKNNNKKKSYFHSHIQIIGVRVIYYVLETHVNWVNSTKVVSIQLKDAVININAPAIEFAIQIIQSWLIIILTGIVVTVIDASSTGTS